MTIRIRGWNLTPSSGIERKQLTNPTADQTHRFSSVVKIEMENVIYVSKTSTG